MTKRMGDSTNSWDIPQNVDMAAGYVNGAYVWNALAWARWIGKPVRRISVLPGSRVGDTFDVERFDLLPWEAPAEVEAARARGVADPWVYVSLSLWGPTRTEFHLRGIPEPNYWIADYDDDPTIPAGAVSKQYANATYTGGHYDLSSVSDAAFGGATQQEGEDMTPGNEAVLNQIYLMLRTGSASTGDPAAAIATLPAGGDSLIKEINEITLKRMEDEIKAQGVQLAELKASLAAGATGGFTISGTITGVGSIK